MGLLIFYKVVNFLAELFKTFCINMVHKYLVPAATDVLEPIRTQLLDHQDNLSQLLLCNLLESLMEAVFFTQRHLLNFSLDL